MSRPILIFFLALVACSENKPDPTPVAHGDSLTGLYERVSAGTTAGRICVTGTEAATRFGLVTIGEETSNCSARGRVVRNGSALTLAIDGAPACTLRATASASGLTLTSADGAECAYYCGTGADLEPGGFARIGTTESDARKAVDIAAEPLCT